MQYGQVKRKGPTLLIRRMNASFFFLSEVSVCSRHAENDHD